MSVFWIFVGYCAAVLIAYVAGLLYLLAVGIVCAPILLWRKIHERHAR